MSDALHCFYDLLGCFLVRRSGSDVFGWWLIQYPELNCILLLLFFLGIKEALMQFLFGYSVTWKMGMIKEGGGTKNTPYHFSYVTKLSHNLVEVEVQFLLLVNKASRIFCVQSVHSNKVNFHFLNVSLSLTFGILSHHARSQILHSSHNWHCIRTSNLSRYSNLHIWTIYFLRNEDLMTHHQPTTDGPKHAVKLVAVNYINYDRNPHLISISFLSLSALSRPSSTVGDTMTGTGQCWVCALCRDLESGFILSFPPEQWARIAWALQ